MKLFVIADAQVVNGCWADVDVFGPFTSFCEAVGAITDTIEGVVIDDMDINPDTGTAVVKGLPLDRKVIVKELTTK